MLQIFSSQIKNSLKNNHEVICLCLQLQNLGCYSVSNLELRLHVPSVAAGDSVFMTVTDVSLDNADNVSSASVCLCPAFRSYLTCFNYPAGHKSELQRAE